MPEVTVSASPTDSATDPSMSVQTFANVAAKFLQPSGHSNQAGHIRLDSQFIVELEVTSVQGADPLRSEEVLMVML